MTQMKAAMVNNHILAYMILQKDIDEYFELNKGVKDEIAEIKKEVKCH